MGTYANYTCFNCQIRRSAIYMKQIEVRQKTGNSGWGISFNPQRQKSVRINAPRNYHSIRKKWVCNDKNACHNPKYYVQLEKRLAAERAEKERLQKIADLKIETKNSIENQVESFLVPRRIARRGHVLKPLIDDNEIQTAVMELKKRFKEQMRSASAEKIICEIIRQGDISATSPLSSPQDLRFKIPSRSSRKDIVNRFFLIEKKPEQNFLQILWGWVLAYFKLVFYMGTLGVGWLLVRILRKKRPEEIYEKEIKKIARLISCHFNKTHLLDDIVKRLKSDDALLSLPYFNDCYPQVIDRDVWKSVTVSKSKGSVNTGKINSKTSDIQTLKKIYESDDFFDICMIVLMRSVGGADGKLSKEEMNLIKSKFTVSSLSEKLITSLLKIKGHQELILKMMTTLFAGNTAVLEMVISNLMTLAEADGEVTQSEERAIHSIGKKLGLSRKSVQNIIDNQNPLIGEDEGVQYFDEDFFPEFEEVMS